MLQHVSGFLTCNVHHEQLNSLWGCNAHHQSHTFTTWITTTLDQDGVIFPGSSVHLHANKHYDLPRYDNTQSKSVILNTDKAHAVEKGEELRVWYGEDLFGRTERDNGGKACVEVWANYAYYFPYLYFNNRL